MTTRELIEKYNIRAHKKFGQNFLKDENVLRKITELSGVGDDDLVLEIGPGLGSLTKYLAKAAGQVIAVEIDTDLIPVLHDNLSGYNNIEVVYGDILKIDLIKLLSERKLLGKPLHVVANLPYYITTPIIMGLLEDELYVEQCKLKSITVMVQKEVAERMQAGPGSKDYGALSLAVQYRARAEIVMKVAPECFIPKPGVGSAVIRMELYPEGEKPIKCADESFMFRVIKASFSQRRKMLVNSLANAPGLNVSKEEVSKALISMGKSENIRGEVLLPEEFAKLSELLNKRK